MNDDKQFIDAAKEDLRSIPGYEGWVNEAKDSMFFGVLLKDLDKEDLLAVIGFLHKDGERQKESYKQQIKFMEDMEEAKKKNCRGAPLFLSIIAALLLLSLL